MSARIHFIALTAPSRRLFAVVLAALLLAFFAGGGAAQMVFKEEAGDVTKDLFAAVRKNDLPAVQSAITAGADIEAVNSWGLTPVDLAVDKGHYEIAHFILSLRSYRAKPNASAATGSQMQTQPQLLPQSSGTIETQKSLGYGVIQRKSTPQRGSAPPPLATPAAPVTRAQPEPLKVLTPKPKPSWPAGKPNPFDPDYVAPDATVPVIGKVFKPGQVPKEVLKPDKKKSRKKKGIFDRVTGVFGSGGPGGPGGGDSPAAKPGARQTMPSLPKLKKAPSKDIAAIQARRASQKALSKAPPKAPPKAPQAPPKASKKGVLDRVLGVVTFGLLGEDEEKPPPFVVEKAPPAATASAPKLFTSPIKRPAMQAALPKAALPKAAPKAPSANITAPPPRSEAETAPSKGFMSRVLGAITFGLLDGDKEPAPDFAVEKAGPKAKSITVPEAKPKATSSGDESAPLSAPTSVVPSTAPGAVPSAASTATSTSAATSKGFLDGVMSVLTFGLLDKEDGGDDVEIKAAPVQLAPPLSKEAPPKKAPPRLAKASILTPPPLAGPAAKKPPPAKPPSLVKLKKTKPLPPEPATAPKNAPPKNAPPKNAPGGGWSVKDVETARAAKPMPVKPLTPSLPESYLKGVELTLGLSVKLGSPLRLPKKRRSKFGRVCVEKKSGAVAFCIKPVDWPSEMAPMVLVGTVMYTGLKTIVRYDEGRATRFHSLFPSASFDAIVAYYARRYGAPTESLNRSIAPLAARRRNNPTTIWRSVDPVTKQVTTLEIRKFDDTRGGFPDIERGAVMLYHKYSKPIFPQLSAVELMLLRPNEVL